MQVNETRFEVTLRLDTDAELVQYRHRGFLNFAARQYITS